MTIYEKLRKTIRTKKMKQQEVANKMGITKSRLSRMLSGDRGLPAADFLAICLVLEQDPSVYLKCDELATVRLRLKREKGEEVGEDG